MKRVFDLICAICGLIILAPIFLFFAIWIKLDSNGPILFRQERSTIKGKIFRIHKFRTMYVKSNDEDQLTSGGVDKRITKVGRIIRKLHLDEMIQLMDVLYGNMSIVGPRPETPQYLKYHKSDWQEVLQVKSGITGLGSILYARTEYALLESAYDKEDVYIKKILPTKLRYERFYVRKQTICFDMKIIFWTVLYYLNLFKARNEKL